MHVSFSYIFLYIIHRLNATLIFVYLTYIFNEITNYNKKQYCSKSPSSQAQNRIKNNFVRLDPIVETMLRRAVRISWIFIHVSNTRFLYLRILKNFWARLHPPVIASSPTANLSLLPSIIIENAIVEIYSIYSMSSSSLIYT